MREKGKQEGNISLESVMGMRYKRGESKKERGVRMVSGGECSARYAIARGRGSRASV